MQNEYVRGQSLSLCASFILWPENKVGIVAILIKNGNV